MYLFYCKACEGDWALINATRNYSTTRFFVACFLLSIFASSSQPVADGDNARRWKEVLSVASPDATLVHRLAALSWGRRQGGAREQGRNK